MLAMPPATLEETPVSTGPLEFRDVLEMIELIKASSNFSEIRLRSGELEIELRRGAAPAANPDAPPLGAANGSAIANVAPVVAGTPAIKEPRSAAARDGVRIIKAPMVGTVYHAPQPGAAPFVTVGQKVAPADPLCIIEVMKLMNSINAGCSGVVSEILVRDAQAVEPGQDLFVIELA